MRYYRIIMLSVICLAIVGIDASLTIMFLLINRVGAALLLFFMGAVIVAILCAIMETEVYFLKHK